ncbi:MAG: type II toxin-antitoxin system RelE/ParE family toxin [Terriglobales bacterium]
MPTRLVRLSEAASVDIVEQADWYEEKSDRKLAERWSKAVTSAVRRILRNPWLGAPCRFSPAELRDVRRARVSGLPKHLVFYRVEGNDVLILRVLHGARDLESLF